MGDELCELGRVRDVRNQRVVLGSSLRGEKSSDSVYAVKTRA